MDPESATLHYPPTEASTIRVLKGLLAGGTLADAFELPEILHFDFEFPLPRGRADIVLFHVDGSVSVIEAKGPVEDARIIAGIGQVIAYAVQLGYSHRLVRPILTAPVTGRASLHIDEAATRAGVTWVPLGTLAEHEAIMVQLLAKSSGQAS